MSKILPQVFQVGGDQFSGSNDCLCYAVDCGPEAIILIDTGVNSAREIINNMMRIGLLPGDTGGKQPMRCICFLTHCHIDHIGAAHQFKMLLPHIEFVAHAKDVPAIEGVEGTESRTAASWYGVKLVPVKVDHVIDSDERVMKIGDYKFHVLAIPGHTPGSVAIYVDLPVENGKVERVLFGQDLHGPFLAEFESCLEDFVTSIDKVLKLDATILCEGHYGVIKGKEKVRKFIETQKRNARMSS